MDNATRKALYASTGLAGKIGADGTLPADYKTSNQYKNAGFTGDVFAFAGGSGNIHAGLIGLAGCGIILAFRGTEGQDDWLNNLKGDQVPSPFSKGKVHAGFLSAAQCMEEKGMFAKLSALLAQQAGATVFFAGHSKGGAMATLLARWAQAKGLVDVPHIQVASFGSPRVGDTAFCADYKLAHQRYESFMDLVPHLPLSSQEEVLFKRFGTLMEKYPILPDFLKFPPYQHVGTRVAFKYEFAAVREYIRLPMETENPTHETLNAFTAAVRPAVDLNFGLISDIHCHDYDHMPDTM